LFEPSLELPDECWCNVFVNKDPRCCDTGLSTIEKKVLAVVPEGVLDFCVVKDETGRFPPKLKDDSLKVARSREYVMGL
jgi:hypothetical protein